MFRFQGFFTKLKTHIFGPLTKDSTIPLRLVESLPSFVTIIYESPVHRK